MNEPLLVVIAGPTGSGKTALSIALAQYLGGEIVSCDSVSVYRGLEIGSAKPTPAKRALVPHHLLDVVDPSQAYTAGNYSSDARLAIAGIAARGRVPIIAGGTGLYLRALLDGLSAVPARDEAMRERLRRSAERFGSPYLHRLLLRLDTEAAAKIHANDLPKLVRAVEVSLLEQRPMTEGWKAAPPEPLRGFRIVKIGLSPPRAELYTHLNRRAAEMFEEGLVEETRGLLAQYGDVRALTSLGYAQAMGEINDVLTRAEAVAAAQQGHRNYAKRQLTWFRKDAEMHWLHRFGSESFDDALRLIESARV